MVAFRSNQSDTANQADGAHTVRLLVEATASRPPAHHPGQVLERILLVARQLIHADSSAVWRTYDGGDHWNVLAFEGLPESYRWEAFESTTKIHLLRDLVISPDAREDPRLVFRHKDYIAKGIYSVLVAPLFIEGESSGTISFYYQQRHEFSETELQYAQALANLAAAALHNFELQEAQRREQRRLTFLAASSSLLSTSLDYEAILQQAADLAVAHIADGCAAEVLEGERLRPVAFAHRDPERAAQIRALLTSSRFAETYPGDAGKTLRAGEPVFYPDLIGTMSGPIDDPAFPREFDATSAIMVPLHARGQLFGVIRMFLAETGRHFAGDDLRLAQDLARRASVAADNARLYRALEVSEARYRSLVDVTSALVWTSDAKGEMVEPQPAWSAYTGQSWEEARRRGWLNAVHPEDRARVEADWEATLRAGRRHHESTGRIWHHASQAHRHCLARLAAMFDGAGNLHEWVGLLMDVHEQKQSEEKLRRTEKLATAGRLAATVAHEINNPLEAVTNLIFLAESCRGLPADADRYLTRASSELERVAHIVRQTLGFYREANSPRPTDVATLVEEVLALYIRPLNDHGLTVMTGIAPPAVANVVAGEIKQVVANLLSNAIDASESGHAIGLTVRAAPEHVEIAVEDSGDGIPEMNRIHIFEPFFTTKKDVGTGLGLWVSKGIVDKHGGVLSYDTQTGDGHGTVFKVKLPIAGPPPVKPGNDPGRS